MIAQRFYVHIHLHLVIHGRIIIIGRGGLYHRVVKKNDKLWDFFQPKKSFLEIGQYCSNFIFSKQNPDPCFFENFLK